MPEELLAGIDYAGLLVLFHNLTFLMPPFINRSSKGGDRTVIAHPAGKPCREEGTLSPGRGANRQDVTTG